MRKLLCILGLSACVFAVVFVACRQVPQELGSAPVTYSLQYMVGPGGGARKNISSLDGGTPVWVDAGNSPGSIPVQDLAGSGVTGPKFLASFDGGTPVWADASSGGALPSGTAGQILIENSVPAPTFITLTGDTTNTSAGVTKTASLQSGEVTCGASTGTLTCAAGATACGMAQASTSSVTPATMLDAPQTSSNANGNGSSREIDLSAPTGSGVDGIARVAYGGTGSTHTLWAVGNGIGVSGFGSGWAVEWLLAGGGTPSGSNYTRYATASASQVAFNAGGSLFFQSGGTTQFTIVSGEIDVSNGRNVSIGTAGGGGSFGSATNTIGFANAGTNFSGTAGQTLFYADHTTGDFAVYPLGATAPQLDVGSAETGFAGQVNFGTTAQVTYPTGFGAGFTWRGGATPSANNGVWDGVGSKLNTTSSSTTTLFSWTQPNNTWWSICMTVTAKVVSSSAGGSSTTQCGAVSNNAGTCAFSTGGVGTFAATAYPPTSWTSPFTGGSWLNITSSGCLYSANVTSPSTASTDYVPHVTVVSAQ
jgi:hypothetical protein